jgi:hypothetical protein
MRFRPAFVSGFYFTRSTRSLRILRGGVELLLSWDLVCFWNIWTLLFGITDAVYRLLYTMHQSIASYRHSGKNSAYDGDVGKLVALGFQTHVNMISRGGHCGTQTIYERYPDISPTFNVLYVYETDSLEYTPLYVEIDDSTSTVIFISPLNAYMLK